MGDYVPYLDGEIGKAFFCRDSSLVSFGFADNAPANTGSDPTVIHFYKVNGTSCGDSSARHNRRVCDSDLVLTKTSGSKHNALQMRTSAPGVAFASLKSFLLTNCGGSEG